LVTHLAPTLQLAATDPDDVPLRRLLRRVGRPLLPALLELALADRPADATPDPLVQRLGERLTELAAGPAVTGPAELALDGQAVMERLGCGPGRQIGQALRFLEAAAVDDPSINTPDGLGELLRVWTETLGSSAK
jgi:hypothetical protein